MMSKYWTLYADLDPLVVHDDSTVTRPHAHLTQEDMAILKFPSQESGWRSPRTACRIPIPQFTPEPVGTALQTM
jgi:hypothetical protein